MKDWRLIEDTSKNIVRDIKLTIPTLFLKLDVKKSRGIFLTTNYALFKIDSTTGLSLTPGWR